MSDDNATISDALSKVSLSSSVIPTLRSLENPRPPPPPTVSSAPSIPLLESSDEQEISEASVTPPAAALSLATAINPLASIHSARRPNIGASVHSAQVQVSSPLTNMPSAMQIPPDVQARIQAFQRSRQGLSSPSSSASPITPASPANISSASSHVMRSQPKLSLSQRRGMSLNNAGATSKSSDSKDLEALPSLKMPSNAVAAARIAKQAGSTAPLKLSQKPESLFSNYSQYIDVATGSLKFAGKASLHSTGIDFSTGSSFRISLEELEVLGELGRGNYGTVSKVLHKPTNIVMAMKEIRLELDDAKFRQIIMELDVLHKCNTPYIVEFYGAFFVEGAVYICMEYMDGGSLDKLYSGGVEEPILAYITDSVVQGLKVLKDDHDIIHRDVKPTNILASTSGTVKLCDFGVSGNLVASIARTNIGCQSYMAPERIKSANPNDAITYTVQSDIWSLGLTLLEIANGSYPYPPETYGNVFSQLSAIVDGEPPSLPSSKFTHDAISFVKQWYIKLLRETWIEDQC